MISDVPLGVMLSGGLDSSLITALMAEQSSRPVQTFSIGFAEDEVSELGDAEMVAKRFGTDHHAMVTSAAEHTGLLDEAIWHLEGPIADVSCLGFMLLSRLAREHVTVALSGQGADELLGGYRKHEIGAMAALLRRTVPGPALRLAAARRAAARAPLDVRARDARADDRRPGRAAARHEPRAAGRRARDAAEPGVPPPRRRGARSPASSPPTSRRSTLSPLGETLHLDTRVALVDNMLLYFDKMSMAASLEVRVPFMDHDVVSFCSRLPDSRRVWHLRKKELLKRASRGLVDDYIIDKPKKGFFHEGLGAWLTHHREDLVRETLLDGPALERGMYNRAEVLDLVERAKLDDKKASQRLFSLLALERWMLMFVDRQVAAAEPAPEPPAARRLAPLADAPHPHPRPERAAPAGPPRLEPVPGADARRLRGDRHLPAGRDAPHRALRAPAGRRHPPLPRAPRRERDRELRGRVPVGAVEHGPARPPARRRSARFDLVHACSPPDFLLLAMLPLRRQGTRFIFDHHDLTPELFASRFGRPGGLVHRATLLAEQVAFRLADVVLSVNDSYRAVALTRGRRNPDDVHVVRTGPDLTKFAPTAPEPALKRGKPYLLSYVGVMGPQDGVDHAVRALAALRRRRDDWHAVFMGDGEMLAEMQALAAELGLDDVVEFAGWVEHDYVGRVLSTSDVCLAPDPKNPLNDVSSMIKISEYMAMGRPMVSYDLRESRIGAGDAAVFAAADDVDDFAAKIDELLDDPERRRAMGVAGRERAEAVLAWEHQERSLLRAYGRALGTATEPAAAGRNVPAQALLDT